MLMPLAAIALAAACGPPSIPGRGARPNIILVLADDQGYADYGFMGSPSVRTPHLDRLAAEGALFRYGYATASQCRPAMLSLLTGLQPYQWERAVVQLRHHGTDRGLGREIEDFATLPRLLSNHGYATFQAGKLWEGTFETAGFTHGMTRNKDYADFTSIFGGDGLTIMRDTMAPVYEFIDAHADRPFFVWLAPLLPHQPFNAPRRFVDAYANTPLPRGAKPYFANITRFDDGVGAVLDHLERRGLRRTTLVIFLADNGYDSGVQGELAGQHMGGPRGKLSLYEAGFRTPIVLNWPGQVRAGVVSDALVSAVDVVATILDYAGIAPPAGRPGRSLLPLLAGRSDVLNEVIIAWVSEVRPEGQPGGEYGDKNFPGGYFLRSAEWRYVWYEGGRQELYDMVRDPAERHDVAAAHPALLDQFKQQVLAWQTEMGRGFELETPPRLPR